MVLHTNFVKVEWLREFTAIDTKHYFYDRDTKYMAKGLCRAGQRKLYFT